MTVEWLLLHSHLLWSGGGIIALSALSWLKIGSILKSLGLNAGTEIGAATRRTIGGQRKRLFRIAFLTSVCLLIWLVITIVTAGMLKDWSRSSELWLRCEKRKGSATGLDYDWDELDFEDGEEVCSDPIWTALTGALNGENCTSGCIFSKRNSTRKRNNRVFNLTFEAHLYCEIDSRDDEYCDCSCDDVVKIERPSVAIMVLGYLAQSLVVVIVGLNMGLRLHTNKLL
jgi:hypothetical protein